MRLSVYPMLSHPMEKWWIKEERREWKSERRRRRRGRRRRTDSNNEADMLTWSPASRLWGENKFLWFKKKSSEASDPLDWQQCHSSALCTSASPPAWFVLHRLSLECLLATPPIYFFQKINWMKPTPTTANWPIRPVNCHLTTWRCTAKSGDSPSSSRLSCVLLMHFWFWFFARDECQLSPHLAYRADWPNERSPGSGPPFEANYLCCAFHLYTQRQSNFNLFLRALSTGNRRFRVNWNDFQYWITQHIQCCQYSDLKWTCQRKAELFWSGGGKEDGAECSWLFSKGFFLLFLFPTRVLGVGWASGFALYSTCKRSQCTPWKNPLGVLHSLHFLYIHISYIYFLCYCCCCCFRRRPQTLRPAASCQLSAWRWDLCQSTLLPFKESNKPVVTIEKGKCKRG